MFHRYFFIQGRSFKHLHERWRDFKLDPNTDDIEVLISDVKQTASQFNPTDVAELSLIKACMPTDTSCNLYTLQELDVARYGYGYLC